MSSDTSLGERRSSFRLKHVARIDVSNVDKHSVDGEFPVRLCNYVDVYKNEAITQRLPFMTATATPEQIRKFSLLPGDVIITKDSETPDDIGVPALVKDHIPDLVCGYHLALMRPRPGVLYGPYLLRLLQSVGARAYYSQCANGVTRFGLTQYGIRNLSVTIPSFSMQKEIAHFLDREAAKADALVAKYERLIELLEQKRIALITQAVTKGLDPHATMKDSGIGWIHQMPLHWDKLRLAYLARMKSGGGLPVDFTKEPGSDLYPVFGSTEQIGFSACFNNLEDAITLARVGQYAGKVSVVPGPSWISDNALIVLLDSSRIVKGFAVYLLRALNLNDLASKTAQPLITGSMARAQIVPLPPMAEQHAIATHLAEYEKQIDTSIRSVRHAIELTREHRTTLITAAVTGQIDVRTYKAKHLEEVVA